MGQIQTGHAGHAVAGAQQAAQHLESGRFSGPVRPQKAEDFTLTNLQADRIGRREAAKALAQLLAGHGNRRFQTDRRHQFGNHRMPAGPTAEKVDKSVLEMRFDRLQARPGCLRQRLCRCRCRLCAQDQAQGAALNHAVADLGQLQRRCQQFAPVAVGIDQAVAASLQMLAQGVRRSLKRQLAVIQQQHRGALLGLVQIGRRPHHGHALAGQFADHAP